MWWKLLQGNSLDLGICILPFCLMRMAVTKMNLKAICWRSRVLLARVLEHLCGGAIYQSGTSTLSCYGNENWTSLWLNNCNGGEGFFIIECSIPRLSQMENLSSVVEFGVLEQLRKNMKSVVLFFFLRQNIGDLKKGWD